MSLNITIRHELDYLYVEFYGPYNLQDALKFKDQILSICRNQGLKRVLCDTRNMEGNIPVLDRFTFGKALADSAPHGLKLALLGSSMQVLPDKFLENVAVTRGVNIRLSTDINELLEWLQVAPSDHGQNQPPSP
ncbi:MAG: hypothetical protein ACYTEQ_12735 [Planctomycetota bacterium]|jgi:hypothetical protein